MAVSASHPWRLLLVACCVWRILAAVAAPDARLETPPVQPVDPFQTITPFELGRAVRHWTIDDGLPLSRVDRLAETDDGYVWVGTPAGLARFNGVEFAVIPPPDGGDARPLSVTDLKVDSSGHLWVVDRIGRVLRRDKRGFVEFGKSQGVPESEVAILGEDAGGGIWLVSRHGGTLGTYKLEQNRFVLRGEMQSGRSEYPYSSMAAGKDSLLCTFFFKAL